MPCLHGKRIIITRPLREAGALRRKLTALGATVYCTPALDIVRHTLSEEESALLLEPKKFAGLIFSSRHGVRYWLEQIRRQGETEWVQAWLKGSHHLAAVGARTAKHLSRIFHRSVLFPGSGIGAYALLSMIRREWHPQEISSILLPVALGEGDELLAGLTQLGYRVRQLPCYRTQPRPREDIDLTPWQQGKIAALLFYSPSAAQAYFDALQYQSQQKLALNSQVFVLGEKTYNTCRYLGFNNVVQTKVTDLRDSVDFLSRSML